MARHEPNIRTNVRAELDGSELAAILERPGSASDSERQQAIACYLSGSEGWDEALQRLGGAFAAARPAELTKRKAD